MSPELMRLAGEAIYGLNWKRPMAKTLGYSPRHISRMMNPATTDRVPEHIRPVLNRLLKEKLAELGYAHWRLTGKWLTTEKAKVYRAIRHDPL